MTQYAGIKTIPCARRYKFTISSLAYRGTHPENIDVKTEYCACKIELNKRNKLRTQFEIHPNQFIVMKTVEARIIFIHSDTNILHNSVGGCKLCGNRCFISHFAILSYRLYIGVKRSQANNLCRRVHMKCCLSKA